MELLDVKPETQGHCQVIAVGEYRSPGVQPPFTSCCDFNAFQLLLLMP